jgi:hypothetical protein
MGIHHLHKKSSYKRFFISFSSMVFVCLFLSVLNAAALEAQLSDCVKCHAGQISQLVADGSKHATEVSCLDCHPRHLPESTEMITACVVCHEGQPHYQIKDCQHCHMNSHMPMTHLRDPLKPVREECLSCHAEVGQGMIVSPSRHSELFCNRCHNYHKEIPECLECHLSHREEQSAADCYRCHKAHQPLQVVPSGYLPVSFCRVCHQEAARDLAATKTNHVGINCVSCHREEHPSTPACQDCHGVPHSQVIHSKHQNCLECHVDAHRLVSGR